MKTLFRAVAIWLTLLLPSAIAEETRDARWFYPMLHTPGSRMHLLTDAQLDAIAKMPSEDIHAIVEAMFLAAAGVEEKAEVKLWQSFRSADEKEARSAENAAYRAVTLPWLMEAFAPGNRPEDSEIPDSRPTATPGAAPKATANAATPSPANAPDLNADHAWGLEDAMSAFEANEHGGAYLALLKPLGGTDGETCMAVTQAVMQRWLAEIEHGVLAGKNSHYQLWLYAPATRLDYPVVQCGNNSFYLDHMFNGKENKAGTLFVDYRNVSGFRDPNTIVYGHHMRDLSMFSCITNYESEGYFQAHPVMLAIWPDKIELIEVFAGYVTDGRDPCYDIAISDEEDMRKFAASAEGKSDFDSRVIIDCRKDRLVTLSTCAYNYENARYIVIGRLKLAWEQPLLLDEEK